jgi:peptidoglycan/LPS O-acetylase OafA/YrhL
LQATWCCSRSDASPPVRAGSNTCPDRRSAFGNAWRRSHFLCYPPRTSWGVILVLLRRLTNGTGLFGPIRERLGRRAYAIYIIHPPVLVAIALAWRQVAAPQLVKFAVTGTVACFACYLLAGLLVRCPGVRRIV